MAVATLPVWRRRKFDALQREEDRQCSVAVWQALERLLAERGIVAAELAVTENEFGKPTFVARPDLEFSLSHTVDRVLAVVGTGPVGCDAVEGTGPVGCDVEQIAEIKDEVAETCLSAREFEFLYTFREGEARNRAFTRLWTRKEAYVKAQGCGLAGDLQAIPALDDACFQDLDFADGTLGCVCSGVIDFI